ncbi:MAG: Ig-like domain-containing protein [Nitrospirae bacterium]|nr:Ig-like domain-containing protein [Nitrospirota bacterium]
MAIPWSLPISFFSASVIPSMENGNFSPQILLVADASGGAVTVAVNPKFYALNPCEKRQFSATVTGADGQEIKDAKVTWQSTSPEIAKIDEKGVAVALKPGSTMIRPIVSNGKGDPASLFVRDKGVAPNC